VAKHGLLCFCSKCMRTVSFGSGNTPKKKGKGSGSKPVSLGGGDSFARRDTGGTPAKRQTQRNHGTSRRGGGPRR